MTKYTLLVCLSLLSVRSSADPVSYAVSTIPASLIENAHAVVRESHDEFAIHRPDAATHRKLYAITVLNKNGDRYAPLAIFYDRQHKISSIRCEIYDADGQLVKKVKNRDLEDRSITNYSLFDDNRIKYYQYQTQEYPYTVVYSYEDTYDGLLHCPNWQPVAGYGLAVERATFLVSAPSDAPFRSYARNCAAPIKQSVEGTVQSTWQITRMPAQQAEPYQPDLAQLTPYVAIAPTTFEFEGYAGNMQDWKSFGRWIHQLNADRGQLPEATQQLVKEMVKDLPDPSTQVRKLYEYMQSKTRYVGIQLGIGGFQPFEASTVDELGYGDCKALSNYMKSLLDVAGIKSNYVLVKAGKNEKDIITDFPSVQFNHAILCVPTAQDTLWLECTSQTNPFGYTGYHTSGRHVLLIDEAGGHLVKTPHYAQEQNAQVRQGTLQLDNEGNGTLEVTTTYSGLRYAQVEGAVRLPVAEQKKFIHRNTDIANFRLKEFSYQEEKTPAPTVEEHLILAVDDYAAVSGKRWFINPNIMNRWSNSLSASVDRETEIVIHQAYADTDSITITLPDYLAPEYTPEPTVIRSAFGEYRSAYIVRQGKVVYTRVFKINRGTFSAEAYDDLIDFYQAVEQADQEKMVFKKST